MSKGRISLFQIAIALGFSLFAPAYSIHAQEGRLQKIRDQVHAPDDVRTKDAQDDAWGDFLSEIFTDEFGTTLLATIAAPFTLPRTWLDDHSARELYFRRFPYERCYPGYLIGNPFGSPELKEKWCSDGLPRGWSVRVSVENGNDFDGLNRFNGTVLDETTMRFGILAQWNWLH